MKLIQLLFLTGVLLVGLAACKERPKDKVKDSAAVIYKGIYSFGPEEKSFKACNAANTFWVVDSSNKLELQYSQLVVSEQAGVPVYIEVTGEKVPSVKGEASTVFDSTLVVYKVIKITKQIPSNCN